MGTADPNMNESFSNAQVNSNADTDTVMTEPYSSSAPVDNRGNSAPQQHANKKQQSLRSQPDSDNAVINCDHAVSTGIPMAVTKADDPAGRVLYRLENR